MWHTWAEIILPNPGFSRVLFDLLNSDNQNVIVVKIYVVLYYCNWDGLIISYFVIFIKIIKLWLRINQLNYVLWKDTRTQAGTHKHTHILQMHMHMHRVHRFAVWSETNLLTGTLKRTVLMRGGGGWYWGWSLWNLDSGILIGAICHALASRLRGDWHLMRTAEHFLASFLFTCKEKCVVGGAEVFRLLHSPVSMVFLATHLFFTMVKQFKPHLE